MKFDSKKNFYYNKDKLSGFFKQNPDCLSQNLYIEKQERLGIFKFGCSTINKVGCGAIAVYNVLAIITDSQKALIESAVGDFEKWLKAQIEAQVAAAKKAKANEI